MSKPTVYIETTIVSYLAARPSRDLKRAGEQIVTHDWWNTQRDHFELVTSELVILEASAGDQTAAKLRLEALKGLVTLAGDVAAEKLARELIEATAVPVKEIRDAIHIAIAATNGVDYLLTWNCTHLANATLRNKIDGVCIAAGVGPPIITTPSGLFDEEYHERRSRELD